MSANSRARLVSLSNLPVNKVRARSTPAHVHCTHPPPVCNASLSGERLLDALSRSNENVVYTFAQGSLGKPTVWIVERGTFSAFRQLRLDEGSNNIGQVKVPVVLPKPAQVTWFLDRVVREL